ncbi:hypothetical protein F5Y17DRAFT_468839 [Xylariaceae sp. FL0594]|nr:hypothetical protein F5Y17DRAFT_468839 [Xylariaceae sp. FL0594]
MASSSSMGVGADTLITIKVQFNNATSRFKLQLRDLSSHIFEHKLRAHLGIEHSMPITVERYSDSSRCFVTIARTDTSLYKQLYRAAKAKKKLRVRVTVTCQPTTSPPPPPVAAYESPTPVTVEDEPECDQTASEIELTPVAQDEPTQQPAQALDARETAEPQADTPERNTPDTAVAPQSFEGQEDPALVGACRAQAAMREVNLDLDDSARNTEAANLTLANFMRRAYEVRAGMTVAAAISASKTAESSEETDQADQPQSPQRPFTVCCNSCARSVPDVHFHCSICDDGDFDLCRECVNRGIGCYRDGHWLIKRTIVDGEIRASSTHIAPKSMRAVTTPSAAPSPAPAAVSLAEVTKSLEPEEPAPEYRKMGVENLLDWAPALTNRTCNCCVRAFPDADFLHCTSCDDYDLCKGCFEKNRHGHHPKHGFVPVTKDAVFDYPVASRLAPGRNARHNALCDGCDNFIRGIRHKCLDCPDWDYCSDCVKDSSFIHPTHRFVPIYEPLMERSFRAEVRTTHHGISCDGPLCRTRGRKSKYIVGDRYKCAVCHDTDFCANCEASPSNTHNKTHPLLKFRTPVRHVSVTTTGEHEDGHPLPQLGDKFQAPPTEKVVCTKKHAPTEDIAATQVQTVVDVRPSEQSEEQRPNTVGDVQHSNPSQPIAEVKASDAKTTEAEAPAKSAADGELVAVFKWDTIRDGTVMPPNQKFEQTWYIKNEGRVAWPAGCCLRYVGGDYMGALDRNHPAGISELRSAAQSSVCHDATLPGQGFPFTALMRTPDTEGRYISYWRLTAPDGTKFGHKLWCEVVVDAPCETEQPRTEAQLSETAASPPVEPREGVTVSDAEIAAAMLTLSVNEATMHSRMILPTLEHESPFASMHEEGRSGESETASETLAPTSGYEDEFEDCGGQDDWAEESDGGFMTDEEYDILDASDEEFLVEQAKMTGRK